MHLAGPQDRKMHADSEGAAGDMIMLGCEMLRLEPPRGHGIRQTEIHA